MYKSYIETKQENCDHRGPSEIGQADYLLTRPHNSQNFPLGYTLKKNRLSLSQKK